MFDRIMIILSYVSIFVSIAAFGFFVAMIFTARNHALKASTFYDKGFQDGVKWSQQVQAQGETIYFSITYPPSDTGK
jgi:hypothetical protein